MRVAHVTATFPPYLGGAGTTAFELSSGLARRGHDVEVFTADRGEVPYTSGAVVHRMRPVFAVGNAPLMPGLARLQGFDVVHIHHPFMLGAELALAAAARHGMPVVVSYHNYLIGEGIRDRIFKVYEETVGRTLVRRAVRVLCVSRAHAATVPYLRRLEQRAPGRLVPLPNGVDLDNFRPGGDDAGIRRELGIPDGAPVAIWVAALDRAHWFKRFDLAVEAVRRAGLPDLHLLAVGGGEWLEPSRRLAAEAGIAERVHFAGPVAHDRLPGFLRAADLLLLSSDLESFGIVLIEAMATGLPTVSTDPPGVLEVVEPGVTGLLAPRGSAEGLANGLREFAAMSTERRSAMGRAGRDRCERRFGWPNLVEQLERVYRGL